MTNSPRNLQFAFMLVVSIVFWWRPLAGTFGLALGSPEYTYILLIPLLGFALIYLERKALPGFLVPSVGPGAALLAVALLAACSTEWWKGNIPPDVRLSVSMFSLVIWWIGSVVFCFGIRAFQAFLFPLCLLFWIVPIPAPLMDELTYFLQQQSAFFARVLFLVAGVPVTQDGTLLSIPDLDIEVARQCSSIRSSLLLMFTTMVFAHLFLCSGWRKALLIAMAVPLAAMKNGLRIFTIVELGTKVDPAFFEARLHHQGGILFLGLSLVAVAALVWALRRTENPELRRLRSASVN